MSGAGAARLALLLALLSLSAAACRRDDAPPGATPSPAPGTTAAASPAASATPGAAIGPGERTDSMTFDGRERTWRLYVPSSLPEGEDIPLVIGLHGGIGSGEQFARNTRFDEQAEEGSFIAVYPDGTGIAQTWNAGACCGAAARNDVDDVAFVAALIDEIAAEYPIDRSRVYAAGHSNGAMMALRLACEIPDRIAAAGAVAGSLETACEPERPVPLLMVHGDADQNHPIEGGSGPLSLAGVDFNSVAATMETLRTINGCSVETSVTEDGGVTTTRWLGCEADTELRVIAGGSHAWPGGTRTIPLAIGEPSQAMDATAVLWAFVSAYHR